MEPRDYGGSIIKFWEDSGTLDKLEQVKGGLMKDAKKYVASDPPTAKSLSQLMIQFIEMQRLILGERPRRHHSKASLSTLLRLLDQGRRRQPLQHLVGDVQVQDPAGLAQVRPWEPQQEGGQSSDVRRCGGGAGRPGQALEAICPHQSRRTPRCRTKCRLRRG